jgi:hypothetical protein
VPYAKWGDVNPALRGIKPQVTLAMANHIASVADGITASKSAENPWAAAIATFKREYKVMGGRWVKRTPAASKETGEATSMNPYERITLIDLRMGEMYDYYLSEAVTKIVGGRKAAAGDFLVVGDPDKPTTWHLPIKVNGKPNRKLAAGAWAALFSSGGFRGNKYQGPDAGKAKSALKAMYKDQEWEMPAEEGAATGKPEVAEDATWYPQANGGVDWDEVPSVPYGAKSFGDIAAMSATRKATERLHCTTYQFGELARNIMGDPDEPDKIGALQALTDEFMAIVEQVLGDATAAQEPSMEVEAGEAQMISVGESHAGATLQLVEAAEADQAAGIPMVMDVLLIEPGWGNRKDMNYYPRDMLARDAKVFEGAKMYESDHRPAEKSTENWVSTVRTIKGFSDSGAPIAEVVVHNPSFAERTRALKAAGMLDKMECSILAGGMARKGKVDGTAGNIVERITEALAVDWVTRAGAGGRALDLAEHAEGGMMKRVLNVQVVGGQADLSAEALKEKLVAIFGEGAVLEAVNLAEVTPEAVAPPAAPPPTGAEPQPGPAQMEAAEVQAAVEATSLPAPAKARLAEGKYADKAALEAAIQHETAYLKAVTGSGAPFGQGPSASDTAKAMTDKEYDTAIGEILGWAGVPLAS